MQTAAESQVEHDLDCIIAAFESAQRQGGLSDPVTFAPPPDSPNYLMVVRELVRVDLEFSWARKQRRLLHDYRQSFPSLFADPESIEAIGFEEYRQRLQAGEDVTPEDYERLYGIDTESWVRSPNQVAMPLNGFSRSEDSRPQVPESIFAAAPSYDAAHNPTEKDAWPQVGGRLLDFELIAELGRGAFATVFLARQGDLAGRLVALKVSRSRVEESDILARLQHTNIVPIYSVHYKGPLTIICMPYFGATTLGDLIRANRDKQPGTVTGRTLIETLCSGKSRTLANRQGDSKMLASAIGEQMAHDRAPLPNRAAVASQLESCLKALSGLGHADAALWIAGRLAEGLYHAHQRGILHGDLKPANVLLADDGQPMLLDFNLAKDLQPGAACADFVGGTLPYMSAESLQAFQSGARLTDVRGDMFSLGVILYELLTGSQPFPTYQGMERDVLTRMIADRRQGPPSLRRLTATISPAVASIVEKCLASNPEHSYATAEALREDIERHLQHRPLRHAPEPSLVERGRKWLRRHPRITSASSIAVIAGVVVAAMLAGFAYRNARLAKLEAESSLVELRADAQSVRVAGLDAPLTGPAQAESTANLVRQALTRFGAIDDSQWQLRPPFSQLPAAQQAEARNEVGELLFLLAAMEGTIADSTELSAARDDHLALALGWNQRAIACSITADVPSAFWRQRELLCQRLNRIPETQEAQRNAEARKSESAYDCGTTACQLTLQRRFQSALPLWQKATMLEPQNVWAWYGLGYCYDRLAQPTKAIACYTACIALKPDFYGWYFRRGLDYLQQNEFVLAGADFGSALRLKPDQREARFNRAVALLHEHGPADAIAELEANLRQGQDDARTRLLLARARAMLGDTKGAAKERDIGLHRQPADDVAWVAHAAARSKDNSEEAIADLDEALKCNPLCLAALESKAHVLSEQLGRTEMAVNVLDRAVDMYPENGSLRAARGVLQARLGRDDAARSDAVAALSIDASAEASYQVAGIYALLSRRLPTDRERAVGLLSTALRRGYSAGLIAGDHDLEPLQDYPPFVQLLQAAKTLQGDIVKSPVGASNRITAD